MVKRNSLKVYIVWAHSGRYNGHALVCAKSKKDVRKFCYEPISETALQSRWLEEGVIDTIMLFEGNEDDIFDSKEELEASGEWPTEEGQVIELEWGS